MCGASIPGRARPRSSMGAPTTTEAVAELGVAYATLQCSDLLARGAPGIHFYTLNKSPATRAILAALRAARPWTRAGDRDGLRASSARLRRRRASRRSDLPAALEVAQVAERLGQAPADHHRPWASRGRASRARSRRRARPVCDRAADRVDALVDRPPVRLDRVRASRTGRPWPGQARAARRARRPRRGSPGTRRRGRACSRSRSRARRGRAGGRPTAAARARAGGAPRARARGRASRRRSRRPGRSPPHARQQVAVGHDDLGDAGPAPRAPPAPAAASVGRHAALAGHLEAALEGALGILAPPWSCARGWGASTARTPRARRSAPPGRSGPSGRACRPAGARARSAARPGRARARAGASRPARAGRCRPARRRRRRRSRTRSRAARPARAAAAAAARARAGRGRRATARACGRSGRPARPG